MTWNDPPHAGERWRGPRKANKRDAAGVETRRVVDRTLGGDVLYMAGRPAYGHQCTEAEWLAWQAGAKRLP